MFYEDDYNLNPKGGFEELLNMRKHYRKKYGFTVGTGCFFYRTIMSPFVNILNLLDLLAYTSFVFFPIRYIFFNHISLIRTAFGVFLITMTLYGFLLALGFKAAHYKDKKYEWKIPVFLIFIGFVNIYFTIYLWFGISL